MKKLKVLLNNVEERAAKFIFQGMQLLIYVSIIEILVYTINLTYYPLDQITNIMGEILIKSILFSFVEVMLCGLVAHFLAKRS